MTPVFDDPHLTLLRPISWTRDARYQFSILTSHHTLYLDPRTGIAWVSDTSAGIAHSCHPNIDRSGSVRGMKKLGYWGKDDKIARSHGIIYNVSHCLVTDDYDKIARQFCDCGGVHS